MLALNHPKSVQNLRLLSKLLSDAQKVLWKYRLFFLSLLALRKVSPLLRECILPCDLTCP